MMRTDTQGKTIHETNRPMLSALRRAHRLHASLLLVFMCSVAAATVSPWLGSAHTLTLICSDSAGLRLAVGNADDPGPATTRALDCPLCLPLVAAGPYFHTAAAPMPTGDAHVIAPEGVLCHPSRALRPPARAPPCPSDPSRR